MGLTECEARYRVNVYRQFLPGRGSTGGGLVQFYGPKATRQRALSDAGSRWSKWEVGPAEKMHTIEVTKSLKVVDPTKK